MFNKGGKGETSIAVRAVVTEAPYDFLIGNIILWNLGGVIDSWGYRETPEFRNRLEWLAGPKLASRREGRVPLCYMRNPMTGQQRQRLSIACSHSKRCRQGGKMSRFWGGRKLKRKSSLRCPLWKQKVRRKAKTASKLTCSPWSMSNMSKKEGSGCRQRSQ
jgi:hypothetical protein